MRPNTIKVGFKLFHDSNNYYFSKYLYLIVMLTTRCLLAQSDI